MAPPARKKRASSVISISSDEGIAAPSNAKKKGKYTLIDLTHSEDEKSSDSDHDAPKGMFSADLKSLIKPLRQRGDAAAGSSKSNARRDAKEGTVRKEGSSASGATTVAPGLVQPLQLARDLIKASSSRHHVASNVVEPQGIKKAVLVKQEYNTQTRIEELEKEIDQLRTASRDAKRLAVEDHEALVAKIGEDLECPMCYDTFKKPSFFTLCGHVFCEGCIEQYCRSRGVPRPPGMILREYTPVSRALRCPTCQELAPKEFKITRAYVLQRLVDTWNSATGNGS